MLAAQPMSEAPDMSIPRLPAPTLTVAEAASAPPPAADVTTYPDLVGPSNAPPIPEVEEPQTPAEAAMEAVQAAARAYEQLRAADRVLHFELTETGMRIEVFDGEGKLLRQIPPTEALALAAGREQPWLA